MIVHVPLGSYANQYLQAKAGNGIFKGGLTYEKENSPMSTSNSCSSVDSPAFSISSDRDLTKMRLANGELMYSGTFR